MTILHAELTTAMDELSARSGADAFHLPGSEQHEILRQAFLSHRRAVRQELAKHQATRPTVVCLCGSTRFFTTFMRANYEEIMAGRIVLSVGFYPHSQDQAHGEQVGCTPEQKEALDQLHMRKIDLADEILVLNVGGYIGDSTRREIAYAEATGKRIRWLEPNPITL